MQSLEPRQLAPDQDPAAPSGAAEAGAGRLKRALRRMAGAALRLHHYRFVRTRMLHDALRAARDTADTERH